MNRRTCILAACLACGLGISLTLPIHPTSAGLGVPSQAIQVGDLKQQIESQLRPRSPQEFVFLERVISMVQRDQLSLHLVKATFNWARRKRVTYRFPYFQRALEIEAARRGVRI